MGRRARLPPPQQYAEHPPWRHRADTVRQRSLNAAWNHLLKQPFYELSVGEIAREVGVSTPALYNHFADRRALAAALSEAAGFKVRVDMNAITEKVSSARAAVKAYLRFARRRPNHFHLLLAPELNDATAFPGIAKVRARFLDDFEILSTNDAGKPVKHASAWWATVHGAACLVAAGALSE